MTKIGILTFHNNENRGAYLQAYALREALEKTFDGVVEVVDYRTRSKELSRIKSLLSVSRPRKMIQAIKDRRIIERSIDKDLGVSDQSIITDNYDSAVNWLKSNEYDIIVTGSDEVWKVSSSNTGSSSFLLPRPFPNLYVLDPSISATKVAFAASGNTTDISALAEEDKKRFQESLESYSNISVRDDHTKTMLEDLGIENVCRTTDPTFLIDIPEGNVEAILRENGINLEKPILGFHGPDTAIFEEACEHYRNRGYQIVTPRYSRFADVEMEGQVDPFEYYALYGHFNMVLTSSLHSTIFSIKHRTPFVTIDVNPVYNTVESKTLSLLQDFNLLERHIDGTDDSLDNLCDSFERLEGPLDNEALEKETNKWKEAGFNFLDKVKREHEADN